MPEYPLQLSHVVSAAVWLAASAFAAAVSAEPLAGFAILGALLAVEGIAPAEDFGSRSPSAFLALLAIGVLGFPAGVIIALGTVIVGDGAFRRRPLADLVWHAGVYAAMLAGGAATVGSPW